MSTLKFAFFENFYFFLTFFLFLFCCFWSRLPRYFASCNNIDEDLRVKPEDDILENFEDDFLENFEDDILENFEDDFLNELVEFCVSAVSYAEQ